MLNDVPVSDRFLQQNFLLLSLKHYKLFVRELGEGQRAQVCESKNPSSYANGCRTLFCIICFFLGMLAMYCTLTMVKYCFSFCCRWSHVPTNTVNEANWCNRARQALFLFYACKHNNWHAWNLINPLLCCCVRFAIIWHHRSLPDRLGLYKQTSSGCFCTLRHR